MSTNAFDLDAPVIRCSNCGGPQESASAEKCRFCNVALGPVQAGVAGAPWTLFWDMHSGGGTKVEPFEKIYIQAPEAEAKVIFYKRFNRSPDRVTCTCCGGDYAIDESPTLAEASAYHRGLRHVTRKRDCGHPNQERYLEPDEPVPEGFTVGARYGRQGNGVTLREYVQQRDVKVIPASEILPEERKGHVPEEGYVWHGGESDSEEES